MYIHIYVYMYICIIYMDSDQFIVIMLIGNANISPMYIAVWLVQ